MLQYNSVPFNVVLSKNIDSLIQHCKGRAGRNVRFPSLVAELFICWFLGDEGGVSPMIWVCSNNRLSFHTTPTSNLLTSTIETISLVAKFTATVIRAYTVQTLCVQVTSVLGRLALIQIYLTKRRLLTCKCS